MKRKLSVKFDRWPWQECTHWSHGDQKKYGWGSVPGMGRFGGGWDYRLGFAWSRTGLTFTLILDLMLGSIRITNFVRKPNV